jgi:hypothetical protein
MAELKKRSTDTHYVAPKLAGVGRILWPIVGKPNPLAMSIKCLSPSDAAVLATISRLKGVAPLPARFVAGFPTFWKTTPLRQ